MALACIAEASLEQSEALAKSYGRDQETQSSSHATGWRHKSAREWRISSVVAKLSTLGGQIDSCSGKPQSSLLQMLQTVIAASLGRRGANIMPRSGTSHSGGGNA
jgi:hypothetical protein